MNRSQNRKRRRADESSRADINPPEKKIKTRSEAELEAWESWEYPPEFYDRLSKVHLSRRALKELNRRTRARRSPASPPASPIRHALLRTRTSRELARFARHGGPDLRDLRGYPHPPIDNQHSVAMSASQKTKSTNPASALPTETKSKRTSPYDRDFDFHLTQHAIHPQWKSQEPDLGEIRTTLAARRPSLSTSEFSDGAFKAFQKRNLLAKDETDVQVDVIPTILGARETHFCARNTVFGNLDPLTNDRVAAPKPDIYYGSPPEELALSVHNELAGHIVPSTMLHKPMAPNFFLEFKGPDGGDAVLQRQARYHGAVGCRGMHSLQNYGAEEPEYDGKAHTFSCTYYCGALQLFAHHVTAPTTEGGRPDFVEGARALRNMLDLADQHRRDFIQAANIKASQAIASQERTTAEIQPPEDSPDEMALSSPGYLYEGGDSQDPLAVDPPTSPASTCGPSQSRPKRQRSARSDAIGGHAAKIRARNTRNTRSSTTATGADVADAGESF
ncbi:hypothetical protein CEP54_003886 [Fusarium duplospermum]|uniref:Uncharacterized protein n=1 Tax=Fusarium duplospermum TaxID=1325734 RepID=A0A428QL79_9HYPO|nr:hypothetical protein CEP54_003886 [Fusarium duplospermum]